MSNATQKLNTLWSNLNALKEAQRIEGGDYLGTEKDYGAFMTAVVDGNGRKAIVVKAFQIFQRNGAEKLLPITFVAHERYSGEKDSLWVVGGDVFPSELGDEEVGLLEDLMGNGKMTVIRGFNGSRVEEFRARLQ